MAKTKGAKDLPGLTPAQAKDLSYKAAFMSLPQLAAYFGMGKTSLCKRIKDDPDVQAMYDCGKARGVAEVGERCYKAAIGKIKLEKCEIAPMIFFLKCKGEEWKETHVIETPDVAKAIVVASAGLAKVLEKTKTPKGK